MSFKVGDRVEAYDHSHEAWEVGTVVNNSTRPDVRLDAYPKVLYGRIPSELRPLAPAWAPRVGDRAVYVSYDQEYEVTIVVPEVDGLVWVSDGAGLRWRAWVCELRPLPAAKAAPACRVGLPGAEVDVVVDPSVPSGEYGYAVDLRLPESPPRAIAPTAVCRRCGGPGYLLLDTVSCAREGECRRVDPVVDVRQVDLGRGETGWVASVGEISVKHPLRDEAIRAALDAASRIR